MVEPQPYEVGEEIGRQLIELQRQIDALQLQFARLSYDFGDSEYYEDEGFTTPLNWIRINCKLNKDVAGDRMSVGRCLERMPESHQAMTAGEIGFGHLVVLARTADAVGSRFDESELLPKAKEMSPGKLYHLCEHYRHAKEPARFAAEQAEMAEQRKLELSQWPNGVLSIKGFLDPAAGAAFQSALEPFLDTSDHSRPLDKRTADALVEFIASRQVVHLQVTAALETLAGRAGSPAAESEFGQLISAKTVERWACDCSLTRVLMEGESTVIEVGRAVRTVKGPRRRALEARDRCCRWPGCERPARLTAGHHLVHWANGGSTDLDNQVLLCHRHHWMVHEGGWQLIRGDHRRLLTIPPPTRFRPFVRGPD